MELPVPDDPVKIALIGCGNRARSIYQPLFSSLKPWVELVAVCDPLKNHCDEMAATLEVPPYYDVRALVRDKPMEAGLIVVPVPGHHSLSVYLSENRIHNHCETSWCSMVCQGRQMIEAARRNKVWRAWEKIFPLRHRPLGGLLSVRHRGRWGMIRVGSRHPDRNCCLWWERTAQIVNLRSVLLPVSKTVAPVPVHWQKPRAR